MNRTPTETLPGALYRDPSLYEAEPGRGWRYALDGRLSSARDFGPAESSDPRAYGLIGVACESWRGLVFANIDKDAPPRADAGIDKKELP